MTDRWRQLGQRPRHDRRAKHRSTFWVGIPPQGRRGYRGGPGERDCVRRDDRRRILQHRPLGRDRPSTLSHTRSRRPAATPPPCAAIQRPSRPAVPHREPDGRQAPRPRRPVRQRPFHPLPRPVRPGHDRRPAAVRPVKPSAKRSPSTQRVRRMTLPAALGRAGSGLGCRPRHATARYPGTRPPFKSCATAIAVVGGALSPVMQGGDDASFVGPSRQSRVAKPRRSRGQQYPSDS